MRNIIILGSTGSIGTQTFNLIQRYPEKYNVIALSAYGNDLVTLIDQIRILKPVSVGLYNKDTLNSLRDIFKNNLIYYNLNVQLKEFILQYNDVYILNAIPGIAGLQATFIALMHNKKLILANKESLVIGGKLFTKKQIGHIIPIDSEHAAVKQCIEGRDINNIDKIILTTSGGPFQDIDLSTVTIDMALKHPIWDMGKLVTINSATMVNKAFEIIEAHHLFNIDIDKIDAIIHKNVIIHAIVCFIDGSVMSYMSYPDMSISIAYGLSYPDMLPNVIKTFDFTKNLEFRPINHKKFMAIQLAKECYKLGGVSMSVYNAANEVAVNLFLNNRIPFINIISFIEESIEEYKNKYGYGNISYDEIYHADQYIKKFLNKKVN